MRIAGQTVVLAPADKVWKLVSDPQNAPLFSRMVREVKGVQWDPPRRLTMKMDGPASGTLTFALTPQEPGVTLVEQVATATLPAVAVPLVEPMLEKSIEESLAAIKERSENR